MTEAADSGNGMLAEMLRRHRQMARLTQRQLADLSGVSEAAIHDMEQRRTKHPRATTLQRIAHALGLDSRQAAELVRGRHGNPGEPAEAGSRPQHLAGPGLVVRALGPLAASLDGEEIALGPVKQRAVLALLAAHPNVTLHREAIIDALWNDAPPRTAVPTLQAYISRLRRALDPGHRRNVHGGLLASTATSYSLRLDPGQLDLLAFRRLIGEARRAVDSATARDLYAEALALWRGDPCVDIDVIRFHSTVVAIRSEYVTAVLELAGVCDHLGQPGVVLPRLRDIAQREPLHEPAHAALMLALAAAGQQAAALRVYEDIRLRLDDQLGIAPSAQLSAAHVRVLRQQLGEPSRVGMGSTGKLR